MTKGPNFGLLAKLMAQLGSDQGDRYSALSKVDGWLRDAGMTWLDLASASNPEMRKEHQELAMRDELKSLRTSNLLLRRHNEKLRRERGAPQADVGSTSLGRPVEVGEPPPLPKTREELMAQRTPRKGRGAAQANGAADGADAALAALRDQLRRVTAERDALLRDRDTLRSRQLPSDLRAAVLRMLREGGQTDRAIARAVGVSPQTVGNLRRAQGGHGA